MKNARTIGFLALACSVAFFAGCATDEAATCSDGACADKAASCSESAGSCSESKASCTDKAAGSCCPDKAAAQN